MIQIEAICFLGYGTKITNHNTQITNNIKITNSNDQNIYSVIGCLAVILSVLNFEFRSRAAQALAPRVDICLPC